MANSFKTKIGPSLSQQPVKSNSSTGSGLGIIGMEVLSPEIIRSTTNPQLIFPETDRVQIDFGLSENDVLLSYVEQIAPLLGNRGINPLRPEILLESEFLPLSTGETSQTSDISLNFGNQDSQSSNLTQAARLIELHRILRELAHSNASSLLDEYFSLSQEQISAAIVEGVIGFEIVFEKICDTTNGTSGTFLNRLSSGSISPSESIELLVNTILTYSDYYFSEIEADNVEITNLRSLFDSFNNSAGFNNQLSKIVSIMLIKILSKAIGTIIAKLVEAFDDGIDTFSLSGVRLRDVSNYWITSGPSSQLKHLITSQVGHHLASHNSELEFEDSYLPVGTGFENYSNGSNISSLLSVLSNLYSSCMFFRTPNAHGFSPHDGDYSKIVFRSDADEPGHGGDRSISNSIHLLKKLTPTSNSFLLVCHPNDGVDDGLKDNRHTMLSADLPVYNGGQSLRSDSGRIDFSTSNIDKIIKYAASEDAGNDIDSGLANIFAAICFDQVVAANCNAANLRYKSIVGESYKPFPALEGLSKLLFKLVDYDGIGGASTYFRDEQFYNVKAKVSEEQSFFNDLLNSDDLGEIFKSTLKVAGSDQSLASGNIAYSPIETVTSGYGSPGYAYYILDALINNDKDLEKLGDFIDEYEENVEFISSFVFDIFGLGFEGDGSVVDDGTVINDLTPMSYFYYYCNQFANDLDRLLVDYSEGDDQVTAQHAINLAFFSQAGSSVSSMRKAFKSAFFGMFTQDIYDIFARNINSISDAAGSVLIESNDVEDFKRNINENFVAATESYLYDMLRHLGLSSGEIRDGSRKFKFNKDQNYRTLLSKGNDKGSDDAQNIIDDFKDIGEKTKSFGGLSRGPNNDYSSYNVQKRIGDRDQFKTTLRQALGVYGTTHSDKYFASEDDSDSSRTVTRGIRPTYKSKFLEKIVQNVPIMGGLGANSGQSVTVHSATLSSKNEMRKLPNQLDDGFNNFFTIGNSELTLAQNTGQFGGIFNTTTFQRTAMIYMYFMRLAYRSNRAYFKIYPNDNGRRGEIKIKNYNTGTRGALTALRLGSASDYSFDETLDTAMANNGFSEARAMIRLVVNAIENKRKDILSPIMLLKAHVRKLRLYHNELKSILNVGLDSYSWKELVASRFVLNNSLLNNFALFNKDTFVPAIQKRLINNFGSNSLAALSDTFILNDLKCMFKIITGGSSDFGLNSNQALGRKKIMHIGIPAGMLSSLQAVCATNSGVEAYRDSTMIAIHISKKDYLNDEVEYYPRTFIFNMRKHISPLKDASSGELSNHLLDFSDTSNYEDVLQSVEFFSTDQDGNFSSLGTGLDAFPVVTGAGEKLNSHRNALLENHVWDYYLRLYTRILAGLDIDEEAFNIKFEDGFFGSPDADMTQDYQDFVNKILELYPSANVNQEASQMFFRTFQVARNRLNFNVNNRLDSVFSGKVFDRIFSVVINERDFLPCKEAFGIDYSDIFEQSPTVSATAATQIKTTKFTVEELQNLEADGALVDGATGESEITVKLDEYVKSLNPDHTHLSSYSVEVSLLKGR